jgi:hypothetical protein
MIRVAPMTAGNEQGRFQLEQPCLYLKKVRLQNIRSFRDVKLDFAGDDGVRMWALVIGDNGVGKTSLLRAIAMGLCDRDSAAGLLRDTGGKWIRKGTDTRSPSKIEITLTDGQKAYSIVTQFRKSPAGFETVDQVTRPKTRFPWHRIFLCGYGANRSTEGSMNYEEYVPADAVYTLFNYDWQLQNPELALRRRAPRKSQQKATCQWLDHILMLPKGSVQLTDYGITIQGDWGKDIYMGALADGYEATLTWILDMLAWSMLAGVRARPMGIVLIDELEQHLHPRWQRSIIRRLYDMFPHVQFIATTHSPVCVGGITDLESNMYRLGLLRRGEDKAIEMTERLPGVGGLRADQILASELFDYLIEASDRTERLLRDASILAGKGAKRTPSEDARYRKVKQELRNIVLSEGTAPMERQLLCEQDNEMNKKIKRLESRLFGRTQ